MLIKNKLIQLLEEKGITRYQFWKDTGLSQNTAYKLCDDPEAIPSGQVMIRIYQVYGWEPGDYLYGEKSSLTSK